MIGDRQRFTPLQRLLHWLMAVCILAMLFIGVGMLSTVKPKYLTLVLIHKLIHKPLGIAILVLALVRLRCAYATARRRCRLTCPSR
jgi:cytochrome b561